MNQAVFIVGPTASGKTALALTLATRFPCLLISSDSRQVYQGMELGTGAKLPTSFTVQKLNSRTSTLPSTYFSDGQTEFWLSSFLKPTEEWSVAHFVRVSTALLERAWSQQKLPIFVGGTGLYTESLVHPPKTLFSPPNVSLRIELSPLPLNALQQRLQQHDTSKWSRMNDSDRSNPRRLVRAIEIAETPEAITPAQALSPQNTYWIGLDLNLASLQAKIAQRVRARAAEEDFMTEVKKLYAEYTDTLPCFSATGYRETQEFSNGRMDRTQWLQTWTQREFRYAKRQLTWYRKRPQLHWWPGNSETLAADVATTLQNWYNPV